jgi:hypothetical protein
MPCFIARCKAGRGQEPKGEEIFLQEFRSQESGARRFNSLLTPKF